MGCSNSKIKDDIYNKPNKNNGQVNDNNKKSNNNIPENEGKNNEKQNNNEINKKKDISNEYQNTSGNAFVDNKAKNDENVNNSKIIINNKVEKDNKKNENKSNDEEQNIKKENQINQNNEIIKEDKINNENEIIEEFPNNNEEVKINKEQNNEEMQINNENQINEKNKIETKNEIKNEMNNNMEKNNEQNVNQNNMEENNMENNNKQNVNQNNSQNSNHNNESQNNQIPEPNQNNGNKNNNQQDFDLNNEDQNDNESQNQSTSSENNKYYKDYIENAIIFWIDANVDNNEFTKYIEELKKIGPFRVHPCKNVDDAITNIKYLVNDERTYIILNPKIYSEFVSEFKRFINEIYIIPKIILFMSKKDKFIKNDSTIKDKFKHPFYTFGGYVQDFQDVKKFLLTQKKKKPLKRNDEGQLTFEYIDCIEKFALPLFYKSLIDVTEYYKAMEFTKFVYDNYSEKSKDIKDLLYFILYMNEIPVELLAKYYAKIYTADVDDKDNEIPFYSDLNKDLREKKMKDYLIYIKILYEGVRLKSLPLASDRILYRGTKISNNEIDIIKDYQNKKIFNLTGPIVFSRSFLSFSKSYDIAKVFFDEENTNTFLSKAFLILEKDDNINYSLSTHADLDKLSFYGEREVLFFPFSTFKIENTELKKTNKGEPYYEIRLSYLGRYLKDVEENLKDSKTKIPETEFSKKIVESGLVIQKQINIELKDLLHNYEEYKNKIDEIQDNNKINNMYKDNSIISELIINEGYINENIRIINTYEESLRNGQKEIINNEKFCNEKEIKENCEIRINGEKIDFTYYYQFYKPGNYKIQYKFKKNLKRINHLFYDCKYLLHVDLSNLMDLDISEINYMFYGCENLMNVNLKNFNIRNVYDMKSMFYGCKSLTELDLSDLNTNNVYNMGNLFTDCYSLTNLNISKLNTDNVIDMKYMFCGCNSLTSIDLSSFNTQNVVDMSYMFSGCKSLKKINLTKFRTDNADNMEYMFSGCSSLKNLNLETFNTQFVTNMKYMFNQCYDIKTINLSSFKTDNVTDMSYMFKGCKELGKLDLSNFNTKNVTNMKCMFDGCNSITEIILTNFKTENVISMEYMFYECNSIKSLDLSSFISENINDISYMFYGCKQLEYLNMSQFDFFNNIIDKDIYGQCISLKKGGKILKKIPND